MTLCLINNSGSCARNALKRLRVPHVACGLGLNVHFGAHCMNQTELTKNYRASSLTTGNDLLAGFITVAHTMSMQVEVI